MNKHERKRQAKRARRKRRNIKKDKFIRPLALEYITPPMLNLMLGGGRM